MFGCLEFSELKKFPGYLLNLKRWSEYDSWGFVELLYLLSVLEIFGIALVTVFGWELNILKSVMFGLYGVAMFGFIFANYIAKRRYNRRSVKSLTIFLFFVFLTFGLSVLVGQFLPQEDLWRIFVFLLTPVSAFAGNLLGWMMSTHKLKLQERLVNW